MNRVAVGVVLWSAIVVLLAVATVGFFSHNYILCCFTAWLTGIPLLGLQFLKPRGQGTQQISFGQLLDLLRTWPKQHRPSEMFEMFEAWRSTAKFQKLFAAALGLLTASFADYFVHGYSMRFLLGWLAGIGLLAMHFWKKRCREDIGRVLEKPDWYIMAAFAIVFAAIYVSFPCSFPFQMNTDEVVIRDAIRRMYCREPNVNPLGPSWYFAFPVFIHILFGWLASMMGGITFSHLRTVHASFGIPCILCSYVFFRTLRMDRRLAVTATIILGFNHSLLAISRMVSRNNTSLLIEVIALSLLFRGMEKKCPFLFFAGGIAAGASFYTYSPARTTVFIFLLGYFLSRWSFARWKNCLRDLLPLIAGFTIIVIPMLWATHTAPADYFEYPNNQFLMLAGGRKVEQAQVGASSEAQGVMINISQGLRAFNWPIHDNSNIYINDGSGFVDPLTGIMIWIGLVFAYCRRKQRAEHRDADILSSSAFLSLWLLFSFFITFAPSYTRLFVVLPFVAYLAAHGMIWSADTATAKIPAKVSLVLERLPAVKKIGLDKVCVGGLLIAVVLLNLSSLVKFAADAVKFGDLEGATFRTVEELETDPDRSFVLSADEKKYEYYWSGSPGQWQEWMNGDDLGDRFCFLPPAKLRTEFELASGRRDKHLRPPFVLFLNRKLWTDIQGTLVHMYPALVLQKIRPDGSLLAVHVDRSSGHQENQGQLGNRFRNVPTQGGSVVRRD